MRRFRPPLTGFGQAQSGRPATIARTTTSRTSRGVRLEFRAEGLRQALPRVTARVSETMLHRRPDTDLFIAVYWLFDPLLLSRPIEQLKTKIELRQHA